MGFLLDETPDSYQVELDDGSVISPGKAALTPEADQQIRNLPVKPAPNKNFVGSAIDALFRPDSPEVKQARLAQAQAGGLAPAGLGSGPTVGQYAGELNAGLMGAMGDQQGADMALQRAQQATPQQQAVSDAEIKALTSPPPPEPGSANDPSQFAIPTDPVGAMSQQADKNVTDAFGRYRRAYGEMFGANAQREADLENLYQGELVRQKAAIESRAKQEDLRQKAMADAQSQVKDSMDKFNAIPDVDPNRIFGKGVTAKKITSAIGLALGAFGASYNGGHNYAMQYLQDQIRNDIDAQKANIDKGQMGVRNQLSLYEMNRQRFQDDIQATAMTEAMHLQYAKTEANKLIAGSNNKTLQAQGRMLVAELDMKQAEAQQKAIQRGVVLQNVEYGSDLDMAVQIRTRADIFFADDTKGKRTVVNNANADIARLRNGAEQKKRLMDAYQEIEKLSLYAKINPVSRDNVKVKTFLAQLSGVISNMQKGPMSDQDAARILEPFAIKAFDLINKGRISEMKSALSQALDAQEKPVTGALQQLGIDYKKARLGLEAASYGSGGKYFLKDK